MRHIAVTFLFCLFTISTVYAASKQPNYMSLAKQHEALGHYGEASNNYINAANSTDKLSRKAEIYVDVVRMFLKSESDIRGAEEMMLKVKYYDPKRANSLLAKHEKDARRSLVNYVSSNRSFGFPHENMRNEAISYFHQFFPQGRDALAEEFLRKAIEENHQYWYDLAAETSEKVAKKIVDRFMGDTSKLSIIEKAERLGTTGKYINDFKVREKYANELLPEGKRLAKTPGEEGKTDTVRKALTELMGQGWVQDNLPERVEFAPGEYIFELEAGEQTPYWITFPNGRIVDFKLQATKGSDFYRIMFNGEIIQMRQSTNDNDPVMKFVAKSKSYIKMISR